MRTRTTTFAAAVATSVALAACGGAAGSTTATGGGATSTAAHTSPSGRQVFSAAGCGSCHTFAAAGSAGTIGPNLDAAHPTYAKVVTQVTHGGGGMPSFSGDLSAAQIAAVARFISSGGH